MQGVYCSISAHAKEFDLFTHLTVTDTFIWALMLQVINALHEKGLATCVCRLLHTHVHPKWHTFIIIIISMDIYKKIKK